MTPEQARRCVLNMLQGKMSKNEEARLKQFLNEHPEFREQVLKYKKSWKQKPDQREEIVSHLTPSGTEPADEQADQGDEQPVKSRESGQSRSNDVRSRGNRSDSGGFPSSSKGRSKAGPHGRSRSSTRKGRKGSRKWIGIAAGLLMVVVIAGYLFVGSSQVSLLESATAGPDDGSGNTTNTQETGETKQRAERARPVQGRGLETNEASASGTGVPISFELEEPGYVTLVIEDENGNRVENLIQDTRFDAGKHTITWDGYDLGKFKPIEKDGDVQKYYDIEKQLVDPGTYYVRGLAHKDIKLKYEFSVQSPGSPPWHTTDKTGNWLADHTPPGNMISLPDGSPHGSEPQVLVTSLGSAEAGHSAMWLTLEGRKLFGGKMRGWNAASAMARESGPEANPDYYAYGLVDGRLYGFKTGDIDYEEIVDIRAPDKTRHDDWNWLRESSAKGLAARNGYVLISFPRRDAVIFFDARRNGKPAQLDTKEVTDPRGMKYDGKGRLYLITGTTIKRFDRPDPENARLGSGTTIVSDLEDPNRLTFGPEGNLYVTDLGESHQVKVFSPSGEKLRTIGKPGGPQLGHYDEKRMSNPAGLTIDEEGKLWVAEAEYLPKRISVWDASSGEFIRAYYGPPKYGGDGKLDPRDRTKFYYGVGTGTIEFTLDWENGTARPSKICYRSGEMVNNDGGEGPDRVVYAKNGNRYFARSGNLYMMGGDGVLKKVAFNGKAGKHQDALKEFVEANPSLKDEGDKRFQNQFISWSDLNGDQKYQKEEFDIRFLWGWGSVYYAPGLDMYHGRGAAVDKPTKFTDEGVPVWDLETLEEEIKFKDLPYMDNPDHYGTNYRGDHVALEDGFRVTTRGPIYGWKDGEFKWTYHSQWPRRGTGFAPVPRFPGQLIATAQIFGTFNPPSGELGPSWALNNDQGSIYLFTSDGLYLTDLGADRRTNPRLGPKKAERGMIIDDLSFSTELFGPGLTQVNDQETYLTVGHPSTNIFEIINLDTTRRFDRWSIEVEPEMLEGKDRSRIIPADPRETKETTVSIKSSSPTVDGQLEDWDDAGWVTVNDRINVRGAVAVSGDTLYAAWDTEHPELLNNSVSDGWKYLFATGGGLDLMVRTDPSKGTEGGHQKHYAVKEMARAGDTRFFITRSGDPKTGSMHAVRFQQAGDGPGEPVHYTSPIGDVQFEAVKDISDQVNLAQDGGKYEVSIPLSVVGLNPDPGTKTKGDIGVLTGEGGRTTNRYYWNNKGASMVSDIPTEARLTPQEWGVWTFESKN